MVEVARRDHPELRFDVGSPAALDVPDGAPAGVLAWYSLIHTPPSQLPAVVAELARVLARQAPTSSVQAAAFGRPTS